MAALALAGAVVKGFGQYQQGQSAKDAADIQAAQVESNAYQHAVAIRRAAQAVRGTARATFASSNISVDTGSPAVIDETITKNSELDALNAIASGAATASSIRKTGKAAAAGGTLSAVGSVLGGVSKYYTSTS